MQSVKTVRTAEICLDLRRSLGKFNYPTWGYSLELPLFLGRTALIFQNRSLFSALFCIFAALYSKKLKAMQPIKTLNDMIVFLQHRGDKKRVAVVCANDASTRCAFPTGFSFWVTVA